MQVLDDVQNDRRIITVLNGVMSGKVPSANAVEISGRTIGLGKQLANCELIDCWGKKLFSDNGISDEFDDDSALDLGNIGQISILNLDKKIQKAECIVINKLQQK